MKLYNLRIEDRTDGRSYLIADIDCTFSSTKQLWFSVESQYRGWLTYDVFDAFLISALYPAHFYKEKIEVEGYVSSRIWRNVSQLLPTIIADFLRSEKYLQNKITIAGIREAVKLDQTHVGTGFSGGVDSFCTIQDHLFDETDEDWKLDTLFFFNIGQNGNVNNADTRERVLGRWQITQQVAEELDLNAVMMDSNMFDFYQPHWEYDAGLLCRIASILVFQRALSKYYISSTYNYGQVFDFAEAHARKELAHFADLYLPSLLSPTNLELILDGAQYLRHDKISRIADMPTAQKFLNVCVNNSPEYIGQNCSVCEKCLRTEIALDIAGKLNNFKAVFNLDQYKANVENYKKEIILSYNIFPAAKDNVDFANRYNYPMPPLSAVKLYDLKRKSRRFAGMVLRKLHILK